jgi:DNA-binding CsgD family transcriptional regulator
MLTDVSLGQGRLAMLAGEPGIGKTRTAQEMAMYAGRIGAQVLWGRCHEHLGAPPYWPWVQSMRSYIQTHSTDMWHADMGEGAADIAEIIPEIYTCLPALSPAPKLDNPDYARFRLFMSIVTFFKHASQRQPLVIVLDNLHWADTASLLLLEFLAQEIAASRLLLLGTYRDGELSRHHPLFDTLGALAREPCFQRIMLSGFSREETTHFIALATGITPPDKLVERLYRHTEGNPMFLTEWVRLLAQEGELTPEHCVTGDTIPGRIPEGIRAVIGRRLNRLSDTCNQLLTLAAVIGREFSIDEIVLAHGDMPRHQILTTLDEAVAVRVIADVPQSKGRYQFSHSLIQALLYEELTLARRTQLHRHVGEALEVLSQTQAPSYLSQMAYHFFEASQDGQVDKAVDYATKAADNAMAMFAYEDAQRYYDMALKALALHEPMDHTRRGEILMSLAQVHWYLGRSLDALDTFRQAADMARHANAPEAVARAALGFARAQIYPGISWASAVSLLEEALRGLGDQDSALRAQLLGSLARSLAFTAPPEQVVAIGQQAVAMARRLGDPAVLAHTLRDGMFFSLWGQPDKIRERLACTTEMLQLAQEVGEDNLLCEAYAYRMFDWLELGNLPMVDANIEAKERLGEALRHPDKLFIATSWRAMRAILEGRFVEGERLAQQAQEWGQRLQAYGVDGAFGIQMFTIRRAQGRLREIAPALRMLVQREAEASTWRPGLAVLYSELDMQAEARAEFERLAKDNFSTLPRDALWLGCMSFLVDVCAYLDDAARAAVLYELLHPYAGHTITVGSAVACYGAAARYLGSLAATMARWEDAAQHFEDALEMNARMNARPWLAYTQYQYADMLLSRQQRGDRHKAASLLRAALDTARELGMRTLEARITAGLASLPTSLPVTPLYPDGLTAREVEVLCLIAQGQSNQEIADTLFISPRTVAAHVANIFYKTNAANRAAAATYAARHGLFT